jgi:cyclophilin family peptidyl-prolyl cis-trans isomerase
MKHTGPGLLSMVRSHFISVDPSSRVNPGKFWSKHKWVPGAYSMGTFLSHGELKQITQFFITTAACDFLDGKHVVFGKVVDGMLTLRKIENVATGQNSRPKLVVKIVGMWFRCTLPTLILIPGRRVRGNVRIRNDVMTE